eukprot:m.123646 g.123646  ORF g.123646 m.123646 type:complete len:697 (+) comp29004_c0_seq4:278-2368(+)
MSAGVKPPSLVLRTMALSKNPPPFVKSKSRLLDSVKKWEALGIEKRSRILQVAAALKQSGIIKETFKRRFRKHHLVFSGSDAMEWMTKCQNLSQSDAVQTCQLMIFGNLIRNLSDEVVFKPSKVALYRFISDEHAQRGPSLSKIASKDIPAQGYLELKVCVRSSHTLRASKWRYCVLTKQAVKYVLYYYATDIASKPQGFIKFESKLMFTIKHDLKNNTPSFKVTTASIDGNQLEMTARATSFANLEEWIRYFVIAGATYIENITPRIAAMKNIYSFSERNIHNKPISFDKYRGQVMLIVNVTSKCERTSALHFTQLQSIQDEFRNRGFSIVGFPCDQFNTERESVKEMLDSIADYGLDFEVMHKVNVNGCGTSMCVPPIWEYLKSTCAADVGSYVPWNFTKFLVNREGVVVRRYNFDETPYLIRDDIVHTLSTPIPSTVGVAETRPTLGNATMTPTSMIDLQPAARPKPELSRVRSEPINLGLYYSVTGKGPFPRSPVTRPSKERTFKLTAAMQDKLLQTARKRGFPEPLSQPHSGGMRPIDRDPHTSVMPSSLFATHRESPHVLELAADLMTAGSDFDEVENVDYKPDLGWDDYMHGVLKWSRNDDDQQFSNIEAIDADEGVNWKLLQRTPTIVFEQSPTASPNELNKMPSPDHEVQCETSAKGRRSSPGQLLRSLTVNRILVLRSPSLKHTIL